MIYLDNAATTQIDPAVRRKMIPWLAEEYGNPGALYGIGRKAADAVAEARRQVAALIGAEEAQIVFTSGGSEANNTVLKGVLPSLRKHGRGQILVSAVEHDSILRCVRQIAEETEFTYELLRPLHNGVVPVSSLTEKLNGSTGLVSVMCVNNETGAISPVAEMASTCHACGVLFHTDCVQAAAAVPLDVTQLACDFLSISSHKLHGPKGVGALYVRDPDQSSLSPLLAGGLLQEHGLRGGTENVAGIVGFGEACDIMRTRREEDERFCTGLKLAFYAKLSASVDAACRAKHRGNLLSVNGPLPTEPGKILNLLLRGVDAETLLLLLDAHGICVSAGSACRSHEQEPSRVLTAMGLTDENARHSIRVSFSRMNTEQEVLDAAEEIADCVERFFL